MTITPTQNQQAPVTETSSPDATAASQPQAIVAAASNAGRTQTGM
jgi:hypothetical protein